MHRFLSVQSTPHRPLPTEVWERVVDFLAASQSPGIMNWGRSSDNDLLSSCLTCRAWLPRSRFHLFTFVLLQEPRHLSSLLSSLDLNPISGRYVQELLIHPSSSNPDSASQEYWISKLPLVLATKLPHLKAFRCCNLDLSILHPRFYAIFRTFYSLRILDLRQIDYGHPDQLIRFVSSVPHVTTLCISELTHFPQSQKPARIKYPLVTRPYRKLLPELQSVKLWGFKSSLTYAWMLRYLSPSTAHLTSVDVFDHAEYSYDGDDLENFLVALKNFLSPIKHTLRHLSLSLRYIPTTVLMSACQVPPKLLPRSDPMNRTC